jgi:hypothetical protein
VHTQIFEMLQYGKNWDWNTLYNMPVWLRKFNFKKIEEALLAQKKANETAQNSIKKPKISKPAVIKR